MGDALKLVLRRDDDAPGHSLAEALAARLERLKFASPLHARRLRGRFPLKVLGTLADPVPGDAAAGAALLAGPLAHAGHSEAWDAAAGAQAPGAYREWIDRFGWLRDVSAASADRRRDAKRTEAFAKAWLAAHAEWRPDSWAPEVTGARLLAWFAHTPWLTASNDHIHRSAVLNALARWARHLDRATARLVPGVARVEAETGRLAAGLLLPGGEARAAAALAALTRTLETLIDHDGAAVTRCPLDLAALGDLLMQARAAYAARGAPAPAVIDEYLARAVRGLAALSMGDGMPAPWHGGAPPPAVVARVAGHAVPGQPGPGSGYQRLTAGPLILVADAGPPPPARAGANAHASTLAFVLSDGEHPLVIACGAAGGHARALGDALVAGLRSTAAHSTLTLADTNSTRLVDATARHAVGVSEVVVQRDGPRLLMRHDGYRRRFGCDHQRALFLAADALEGEDRLVPAGRVRRPAPRPVAVRFHLAPGTEARIEGGRARLDGPAGPWTLTADWAPAMEASLWVTPAGVTRPTRQIVLLGKHPPGSETRVGWRFERA